VHARTAQAARQVAACLAGTRALQLALDLVVHVVLHLGHIEPVAPSHARLRPPCRQSEPRDRQATPAPNQHLATVGGHHSPPPDPPQRRSAAARLPSRAAAIHRRLQQARWGASRRRRPARPSLVRSPPSNPLARSIAAQAHSSGQVRRPPAAYPPPARPHGRRGTTLQ
jgi:hypothetical protein